MLTNNYWPKGPAYFPTDYFVNRDPTDFVRVTDEGVSISEVIWDLFLIPYRDRLSIIGMNMSVPRTLPPAVSVEVGL